MEKVVEVVVVDGGKAAAVDVVELPFESEELGDEHEARRSRPRRAGVSERARIEAPSSRVG
jgi:hypothetical protein